MLTLAFSDLSSILNISFLPQTDKAYAATGDFSIFKEVTGTETIPTSTQPALNVSWDTNVTESANITKQSNNSDIKLTEGGKYLVMYNVWSEQGTSTGGNRRSQATWLNVNGTPSPYGWGGGYLRDSGGTVYMYNEGAAILDTTANATMTVNVQRNDTNPTAGVNMRGGTNGVSVLKFKDNWDYLRIQKTASSSDIDGNTTFTAVTWDQSDEVDTGSFAFTPTSGNLTLKGDSGKHFLITTNVKLNRTANNIRENYEMALFLDGNEIPGTRVTSYPRGNNNGDGILNDTLVYSGIIAKTLSADQTLTVRVRRESTGSGGVTVIVGGRTALSAVALPDTGSYIMLGRDTNLAGTSTQTGIDMTKQYEVDSYAFSHSTTTNPSRVNIDRAGDYLFFSSAYATNSTDFRQPFRIDWRKNGSTNLNYGSHGAFVRGNSSFSGGSAGGLIMNGLSSTDYIEMTQYDEVSSPTDLNFLANRVALQGVLLDSNFWGTDVVVSATGTHAVETDIPTTNFYGGGAFVIKEQTGTRNITSVRITESGTVDAKEGLSNVELWYDLDTTGADGYDCSSESYNGDETQYEVASKEFNAADGSVAFSGSVSISTTQSMCVYVVYDVVASSSDSETVQLSIADPSTDVSGSGSPTIGPVTAVGPTGSTTLRNAELTQTHYRWLNDDGVEGSATAIEAEDTPAIGFANGTTRRLRLQVDAAGSTSSIPTTFRLDYATKTAACSALTNWINVGSAGSYWNMSNSSFITDGTDSTNIGTGSGGLTDPSGPPTFLTPNGALRDTNSTTSALTLANNEFLEFEFAIQPTAGAPQGNTYCFRLSDNGTALQNYSQYPEGTISADIDVSASSSQVASLNVNTTNQYIGGQFVIERNGSTRTLTGITITETGTVDAAANLANPKIFYDLDTTAPYDCTGESYAGTEPSLTGTAFSGANGTSSFSTSLSLSSTQSFCGYVVLDVGSGATNGETINIEITDPSSDVVVTGSTVGPSTAVSPTGSTTIAGPVRTQVHYHWRNDNGDETDTGATSASGGVEDTAITGVPKQSTRRLRIEVSNEGTVSTQATTYRLEYGTKVTTCANVGSWSQVGVGVAFATSASPYIADGNTTNLLNAANGAMTDANTNFVGTGALRESTAESGAITLSSTQFTELEYSIEATDSAGDDTTYCFRVTDAGTPLESYSTYPELTTRQKQDFFIQSGRVTFTGTSTTLVAGTDYIAPSASSSTFIRINDTQLTGAGTDIDVDTITAFGNNQTANNVTLYIENPENVENSVTIARPTTAIAATSTTFSWEMIEFVGIAATDNEMIVRDQGTVTFGTSATVATGTVVSGVVDDADVVVFITGAANPDTGTGYASMLSTAEWNATSSVPVFTRGFSGSDAVQLSYAVVEFTGANWSIQRIEHNYTASGTVETENINAIASLDQAFIHTQKRVGSTEVGLDDMGHEVWISSLGAVSFELEPGVANPSTHYSVVWVIENTQTGTGKMKVYQSKGVLGKGSGACGGAEPCTENVSIGGNLTSVNNASIFMNNRSSGAGAAFPRPIVATRIISTTQYETWRSDTGQPQTYRTEVVGWPVARTSIRQNYYRFYVDNDALDPTDPWPVGTSDLGENTSITGSDDPLGAGDRLRLRMTLLINNATLPAQTTAFKLQFAKRDTTCSAIDNPSWTDLGAPGSGEIWRGYNTSVTDGTELATSTPAPGTLNISVSDVAGTFEEQNNSAVNPYAVNLGEDVEYDWVIEHNGATQLSDYCFRMIKSDNTILDGYNYYPVIRTTGYTPVIANWRWYDDATSTTPLNPLGAENVAPTGITNNNELKLRVTAAEVEGAPGTNIKFALQYSEFPNFEDGGTTLTSTTTCTANSLWCYADGGGVDNATITTALLSDADTCVASAGLGCGVHNERATTTSTLDQPALSSKEFEFTLKNAGARANAVYYFRLYDVTNDVALSASSSYPSLQVEGAKLTFTLSGLAAGTDVDGTLVDVSSQSSVVPFGSLPLATEYTAAQRLTVDTNATDGYQILMFADSQLINTYGQNINPITGTNASPVSWSTGCASGAVSCFGYHLTDSTLSGGSTRFAPPDTYAQLDTVPLEVMYSSVPVNESSDILYKVEITDQQPSGDYQTNLTYIAVPVF